MPHLVSFSSLLAPCRALPRLRRRHHLPVRASAPLLPPASPESFYEAVVPRLRRRLCFSSFAFFLRSAWSSRLKMRWTLSTLFLFVGGTGIIPQVFAPVATRRSLLLFVSALLPPRPLFSMQKTNLFLRTKPSFTFSRKRVPFLRPCFFYPATLNDSCPPSLEFALALALCSV